MSFILSYKLFEETSLLNIGVPYSIMKSLQINYEISKNAKWKSLKNKKDILSILKKSSNNLIISILKNKLFVTFSYNDEYFIETFELIEKDDFGNENWKKVDRIQGTLSEVTSKIERGCKSYKLESGDWKPEYSTVRKIRKEESKFEDTTINFKKYFADNFTRVVKRMYGKKADIVTGIIINHLKNTKMNLSNKQIKDILFLNIERAKEVSNLNQKAKEKDPFKLQSDYIKNNSLTIFDNFIVQFEDDISDKYKEYLNIPILLERYSIEKIITAFAYFLYTNKIMNL